MSLDSYSHLQTAVADWLNRTDLTSQIPDFIALAEAKIKRKLRRSSTRATITIATDATTPPADMAELRSAYLVSSEPARDVPLRVCTPEMLAERRARSADVAGRPTDIAYVAGQLLVAPTPDQSYSCEIVYFTALSPLSNTTTTNAVLSEAPDIYLYGTLAEAEPYLEHDERIDVWKARFEMAIDDLNDVRTREEYGASLRGLRLPVVFSSI